ncbi:DUF4189 domain-containing protein [Belnapia sp. T6]|uniref:DUF4189 domain-containing protein n=1 Tax=Belnapia mucosa TaxID=2804532 RepID=A0ABS1V613_9PROT|nr:DUF4189 domain-containing protein [Belnapia mucosa]MBL6457096.1 DUF4189 domain-containing protein [Belnapia mucosa]
MRILLPSLALLLAGPAAAQTVTAPAACLRSCGAATATVRANPPPVQACLIRCAAAQDFQRHAGRSGAATGRGVAAAPTPPPPASANYAALAGPTGQRLAVASRTEYVPQVRGLGTQAMATRPAGGRTGAIYLAPAPSTSFGLSYGMADRLAAHGHAERHCQARGGACRLALEFTDRCGAVAQAKRANGLIRTADPSTFTVTFAAGGAGPTREVAESQAIADCSSRDRSAACEIVASGCGG